MFQDVCTTYIQLLSRLFPFKRLNIVRHLIFPFARCFIWPTLSHSHTGSYDLWIVRLVAIGPRCDRSAIFATISSSGRVQRSISTRGRAITTDWRISMTRAVVGNRASCGSDQQPMYEQLLFQTTYDQSWRPATDGTINHCILRPIVRATVAFCMWPIARALVASCDRVYDQLWHPTADRRSIVGCNDRLHNRRIVRPNVSTYDRSYDQSWQPWHQTTDRTINRSIVRPIIRSIVRLPVRDHATRHDWWFEHVRPICERLRFGIAG